MSVCVAIIEKDGKTLHFAADSRVCAKINGIYYKIDDNQQKIYNFDGFIAYISGITELAENVAKKIKKKKTTNIMKISNFMKEEGEKYIEDRGIPENPHFLQAMIPIKLQDQKWRIALIDSAENFQVKLYWNKPEKHSIYTIGKGGKTVFSIVDANFGKKDIVKLLVEGFSAAANEQCGGTMTYYRLGRRGIFSCQKKIPDLRPIRTWQSQCEGDGMYTRPDGYESAVAYIEKYNGGLDVKYFNSNYAKERSLKLTDDGIQIFSEEAKIELNSTDLNLNVTGRAKINHASGTVIEVDATGDNVKIMHKNGSYYELSPTGRKEYIVGNAETVCTGNFKVTASRIDLN